MTYYLVDSENDGGQVSVIERLLDTKTSKVKIIVFTFKATAPATKDLLLQHQKEIKSFWCENGHKNAMDFCIASYVGKLLTDHPNDECVICSNDTGYEAIVHFWERLGKRVRRLSTGEPEANKKLNSLEPVLQDKVSNASAQCGISINNIIISCSHKELDYRSELRKKGYSSKQISSFAKIFSKADRKQLRKCYQI